MFPHKIFLKNRSKPGVPELDFKVIKKFHCIFKTFLVDVFGHK